jgi:hypothetical protein
MEPLLHSAELPIPQAPQRSRSMCAHQIPAPLGSLPVGHCMGPADLCPTWSPPDLCPHQAPTSLLPWFHFESPPEPHSEVLPGQQTDKPPGCRLAGSLLHWAPALQAHQAPALQACRIDIPPGPCMAVPTQKGLNLPKRHRET